MTNEEMLELIRLDRPGQVINEVLSFSINEYGFYDVNVDMQIMFFDTKVLHVHNTLPYPISEYLETRKLIPMYQIGEDRIFTVLEVEENSNLKPGASTRPKKSE